MTWRASSAGPQRASIPLGPWSCATYGRVPWGPRNDSTSLGQVDQNHFALVRDLPDVQILRHGAQDAVEHGSREEAPTLWIGAVPSAR
jgi:hypothetical protein